MKLVSTHQPQFVTCFFVLVNVTLLTTSSIATTNMNHPKKTECHLEMSSYRSYYAGDIANEIEKLHSINLSITNLATVLTSSLNKEDSSFTHIQTKVAPALFETLKSNPQPVLVSFTGINGVFFSYFSIGEGEFISVYANDTLSSSSYTWYTQSVSSSEAGKLTGDVKIDDSHASAMNAEFFLQAVNMTNGYTSVGRRWCGESEEEILGIRTVFFEQLNGAISLGFPIEDLIDERTVRFEDAQCSAVENEKVDSVSSSIDSIKSKSEANALAYAYQTLVDIIKKNLEEILVLSIAIGITFAISTLFSASLAMQFARRERELKTQLSKYKKDSEEAERKLVNKTAAVSTASHDIRNALAAIISLIELSCTYSSVVSGSDLEINLRQMNACARDLLDMLNSILDASKLEAGKMQLDETKFDLSKLVEDVVDLYHPVGIKKGVDVVLDPCDGSLYEHPIVNGDRLKLKQVMCNLLSNAVKFTTEGHVTVRAWARRPVLQDPIMNGAKRNNSSSLFGNPKKTVDADTEESKNMVKQDSNCVEYVFEVDDTGKGIPKDKRKTVFENYTQVSGSDAAVGTGLGLGIVQSLVRLMGGNIEIVDKPFDQRGTCFKFNIFLTICVSHINVFPSKIIPDRESTIPKASLVVLLIQNEGRRKMIQRFLERIGVMVVEAEEAQTLPSSVENINHRAPDHSSSEPCLQSPISFVLLIIDANAGEFSELKESVARTKKELRTKSYHKVFWLEGRESGNRGDEIFSFADYFTTKPLHGSRLFEVVRLLPEFTGQLDLHSLKEMAGGSEVNNMPFPVGSSSNSDLPLYGKRVLVAEDNEVLMLVATRLLTQLGAVVVQCCNGDEAVDLVSDALTDQLFEGVYYNPYDFILMDCNMPVMDGCEATELIREQESSYGLHIPIIALTAHMNGTEISKCFEAGMDYHLMKPLEEENLVTAVNAIGRQTMIRELKKKK